MTEILHFVDYLAKAENEPQGRCFKADFPTFDDKLGGIETGEVVVISGKRKNGKTLFAESWMKRMLLFDPLAQSIIFSFEIQAKKLLIKYADNPSLPIYVPSQLKTMDFEWFKEQCRIAKEKYFCNIVLVDHLHFMVDMNTKQNMSLNIGAFMRRLKQEIAIGFDMAVILIAHQGQTKDGQTASVDNIRDSSFVAQESDSVIMVSRYKNLSEPDLKELEINGNIMKADDLRTLAGKAGILDDYSMNLSLVSIECTRRTGVFEVKKVFRKVGYFLEEL